MQGVHLPAAVQHDDTAFEVLSAAILKNPKDPLLYYQRGRVLSIMDDLKGAIRDFKNAVSLNFDSASADHSGLTDDPSDIYYYWASSCLDLEMIGEALNVCNIAMRKNKIHPGLHLVMGKINMENDQESSAIKDFNKCIKSTADTTLKSEATRELGKIYLDNGNLQKAIMLLTTAIHYQPENGISYFYRGSAYMRLENAKSDKLALADLNKAISFNPDPDYYYYRAICQMETNISAAIKDIKVALDLAPDNDRYLVLYGDILTSSGQHQLARQVLTKALQNNPNNEEFKELLNNLPRKAGSTTSSMQKPLLQHSHQPDDDHCEGDKSFKH